MRFLAILVVAAGLLRPVSGTTLQQLSLDEMAQKSTLIVRGTATPAGSAAKGSIIYSHYQIQVTDQWKGAPISTVDVAIPGGVVNGSRQTYSGAPALQAGQDYIFFLWTSRTGMTQIIGLSQGLYTVRGDMVSRAASQERMLDATGNEIQDTSYSKRLYEFKTLVYNAMAKGNKQ